MCGVFGYLGPLSEEKAAECINSMIHRGPDGFGLWQDDGVTLGHRRLSILDLSERGEQPMSIGDGRYWIVNNGEIYNFVEIRKQLEGKGHRFRSQTDTEVALAAFVEWGPECVDRFNGMWSMAIWDRETRELFLSRDRFGKKPLFYADLGDSFAFASEMKALFPLLERVEPNLDLVTATDRIFTYESSPDCVVRGISRFPAGHVGRYRDGALRTRRFWCTLDHLPQLPSSFGEQVEAFRELFFDACRIRMRSDVPIGTALSGGLDSSATISAMAHLSKTGAVDRLAFKNIQAFVSSFPGSAFDEAYYAQKVIDFLGVKGTICEIDPLEGLDHLERYYYLFEELYITSPIPFMITYGAIKNGGVSVTLDGHAGDELFCGYTSDILAAFYDVSWRTPFQALEVASAYVDSFPSDSPQFPQFGSKAGFAAKQLREIRSRRRTNTQEIVRSRDEDHARWSGMSHLNKRLYVHTHETTLPTLLRNYDRLSMGNSVEIRMPFMDHRLAAFAFALPGKAKLRKGFSKGIVRPALEGFMPDEVTWRKTKIGWSSPILDWIKGPLKPYMLDMVESQAFRESTLIDAAAIRKQVQALIEDPAAQYDDAQNTWTQLSPFLWEKAVIKQWRTHYSENRNVSWKKNAELIESMSAGK